MPAGLDEGGDVGLRSGAVVADDLAGGQRREPAAAREIETARQAQEETRGVEVAGTGGIHDMGDRRGLNGMNRALPRNHRALRAAGEHGDGAIRAGRGESRVEVPDLVKRHCFVLVGEQDIDVVRHQIAQFRPVALDAEGVRE